MYNSFYKDRILQATLSYLQEKKRENQLHLTQTKLSSVFFAPLFLFIITLIGLKGATWTHLID